MPDQGGIICGGGGMTCWRNEGGLGDGGVGGILATGYIGIYQNCFRWHFKLLIKYALRICAYFTSRRINFVLGYKVHDL